MDATFTIDQPAPITPYTACYCEENIFLLGEALLRSLQSGGAQTQVFAVVISNPTKTVAIWQQKASHFSMEEDFLVVWDYHVILVLAFGPDAMFVYDADSRLGSPCPWTRYINETFKAQLLLDTEGAWPQERFRCGFRVVPMRDYLGNFSSDRSHMLRVSPATGQEEYAAPPPNYPLIGFVDQDERQVHNLMTKFVDMSSVDIGFGTVLSDMEFLKDVRWIEGFQDESKSLIIT